MANTHRKYCDRIVLRRVMLASVIVLSSVACSSTHGEDQLTPVASTPANPLSALVVAPPSGFERSGESDAHNGTMTPAQFDRYIGESDASSRSHLVRGYQATYDDVRSSDT